MTCLSYEVLYADAKWDPNYVHVKLHKTGYSKMHHVVI
jgi:hypothetical protein